LRSAELDARLNDAFNGDDIAIKETVCSLRFTTKPACNRCEASGLFAPRVAVRILSEDGVITFGLFSTSRA